MRIRTPLDLGLLIRERRRQLGLSQAALALEVGASRQWLVEVEHGKPGAELGLVLRTLIALGVELEVPSGRPLLDRPEEPDLGIDIDAVIERARGKPP